MSNQSKAIKITSLITAIVLILCSTILLRPIEYNEPNFSLFWSYIEWFKGNWIIGWQVVGNIILFVPVGFLISTITNRKRWLIIPFVLSCTIEIIQFLSMRGLFELDDIFNNMIGSIIGWIIGNRLEKKWISCVGLFFLIILGTVALLSRNNISNLPKSFCIQIDDDGKGFLFRPGWSTPEKYSTLFKEASTGKIQMVEAKIGLERPDVADYFGEKYRYSGFELPLKDRGDFEIIIRYNPFLNIPTGLHVSQQNVRDVNETETIEREINEDYISEGVLVANSPDYHCWIYQYDGALYWIVDQDFYFEEDGSTYIQYQLWTTKPENLPKHRIENGWFWDNIGGYFEDFEIQSKSTHYRIMKREIPTDYPITSIETGYYIDGKWVWQEFFRPKYDFLNVIY